jgi:ubiquitin C-terminal hydrolase
VFNHNAKQQTKQLTSILSELIDFNKSNTSLYVDVALSVIDKYKDEEQKRSDKSSSNSSSSNGMQTRSQKPKSTTSLLDCFKYFTTKEMLSDDDQWMCAKCKVLKKTSKKFDLWLLPKVLIVQLKRFTYLDGSRSKNNLFIDCPLRDLDLSQFVLNPDEKVNAKYELIAVSNHMGGLGGGHYTAHAKNSVDQKWHTFDDARVSEVDEDSVISKSAYVLIYQQQAQPVQKQSS